MTAQQDFVRDPVTFMQENILRCQFFDGGVNISESKPLVVTVKVMNGDPKIANRPNGKVYYLTTDVTGCDRTAKVPIFWLGYKDNDTRRGMLNNSSRLMFTANMDGCTLGVGSQNGEGGCLVSHANSKKGGSGGTQSLDQHTQLRDVFDGGDFWTVDPTSYMDGMGGSHVFKGTNFGVNQDGWWMFYTHRWMQMGGSSAGNYVHGDTEGATFVPG
ncbi:MAG TPA: hypothetical protein VIG49_06250 [Acetobacteraceae bacterium]